MNLAPIEEKLLRIAEARVAHLRLALAECHPDDRRRRERITADLSQAERSLRERYDYLSR